MFSLRNINMAPPLTRVSIQVQVRRASEGKPKAGGDTPRSPLARDHLRRLFAEPLRVSVVDVDQPLLPLPSEWTADGYICPEEEAKSKPFPTDLS